LLRHDATGDVHIRADLVSYADAVEVEMSSERVVVFRWRFVRDVSARAYGERARRELELHGYRPRWREPDEG
jgi:hypothetical protein